MSLLSMARVPPMRGLNDFDLILGRTAAMTVAVSALSEEEMGDVRRSTNR